MFQPVWSYLERYGWYTIIVAILLFAVYQKYLSDKLQEFQQNREVARQKKDDDVARDKHKEMLAQIRLKQQEEYNREVAKQQEIEKQKAEQRRLQKLGLNEEVVQEGQGQKQLFDALTFVQSAVVSKPVVVFSKSWCPFSRKAKQVLMGIYRVERDYYNVIELDEHEHGDLIQEALQRVTGGRSVPRVFINGNFIGGGDDTERLHKEGKMASLLKEANVKFVE